MEIDEHRQYSPSRDDEVAELDFPLVEQVRERLQSSEPGEYIDGYRPRDEQIKMAESVAAVFADPAGSKDLIIEASTGIGKTLAYALPALMSGRKVLIATATKYLQDQLFSRDLIAADTIAGSDCHKAVLKGRTSYVCLERLEKAVESAGATDGAAHGAGSGVGDAARAELLENVVEWSSTSRDGDLDKFTQGTIDSTMLTQITSTSDNCTVRGCPKYGDCFVYAARRKAHAARVVVTNHALLLHDLQMRSQGRGELLPHADVCIFDEAHRLIDTASDVFSVEISLHTLARYLNQMGDDAGHGEDEESKTRAELAQAAVKALTALNAKLLSAAAASTRKANGDSDPSEPATLSAATSSRTSNGTGDAATLRAAATTTPTRKSAGNNAASDPATPPAAATASTGEANGASKANSNNAASDPATPPAAATASTGEANGASKANSTGDASDPATPPAADGESLLTMLPVQAGSGDASMDRDFALDEAMEDGDVSEAIDETLDSLLALAEHLAGAQEEGEEGARFSAQKIQTIVEQMADIVSSAGQERLDVLSYYRVGINKTELCMIPFDLSERFSAQVRQLCEAGIYTSATMTAGGSFGYFTSQLGLDGAATLTCVSDFDYASQSLLWLPGEPGSAAQESSLTRSAGRHAYRKQMQRNIGGFISSIVPVLRQVNGRSMILLTSQAALLEAADQLRDAQLGLRLL
ncbi:MAG: ATP-dependent DNA helicase, partial [Proteobacteria bacterium]|nr:ATP-dependent DNA helicase [Pseudomonadota bacterium]